MSDRYYVFEDERAQLREEAVKRAISSIEASVGFYEQWPGEGPKLTITENAAQARRPFCELIWENEAWEKRCQDYLENRVGGCKEPEVCCCWVGVHNIISPVKDDHDDFQVTLIGGEFRVNELREEAENKFSEFIADLPEEQQDKLRKAWLEIPEVNYQDAAGYKMRELHLAGLSYKQAIRQRSEFRYMTDLAAHDFIVALQALIADVEVLKIEMIDSFKIGRKWEKRFEKIIETCELHHQDLEAKLERDKSRFRFVSKSISRVIYESIDTFVPKAKKRWIEFDVKLEQSVDEAGKHKVTRVKMDRVSLGKAFENMLDNAVKYSNPGNPNHPNLIEVNGRLLSRQNIPGYNIIIKSQGIGIDKDELDLVFEPGYQSKQRFEKGFSGYGMGLSNVKQCINEHNGQVSISSQPLPDKSWLTTIAIWLPLNGPDN